MENSMTKMKLLTLTAILATSIASPVMAQHATRHADRAYTRDSGGFWPADVAAGVVGGAIGTAGAIATAPFRDSYAYYNGGTESGYAGGTTVGYNGGFRTGGSELQNGICQPGTWVLMEDGRRHICQ